jgi:AcrR family transcriptional regulator
MSARPRTKPARQRRDELMSAALRLFVGQGMAATTIEQITIGADVAKGTFYLHFSSKEDLLAALRQRFAEDMLQRIQTVIAVQDATDWRGKLAAWAGAAGAFYLESMPHHDALFAETRPPTRDGLVDNILVDHLSGLLRDGADAGAWSVGEHRFTAVFLFSGLHGIIDAAASQKPAESAVWMAGLQQAFFKAVGLAGSTAPGK